MQPRAEGPDRSGGAPLARPLPLLLLVVLAVAAVGVAAKGGQLLRPALALDATWTWLVRITGLGLLAAGARGLVLHRRRAGYAGLGPDPSVVAVRTAATIMGAVFLLGLFNPPPRTPRESGSLGAFSLPPGPWGADLPGRRAAPPGARGGESGIQGDAVPGEPVELMSTRYVAEGGAPLLRRMRGLLPQILFVLLLLMAFRYLSREMNARRTVREARVPLPPARARAGLEASLRAVREYGRDPRGRITRAYDRLLEALAEAGAPREPHEAPHEHLYRALGPLGVRPEPLHRLARIYVLAQFGARPVTERHQAEAARALEAGLADLRSVPASGWREDGGPLPQTARA